MSVTNRMSQTAAGFTTALLLNPAAMIAMAFGLWRLGEDLGWTTKFLISEGLFSHWIVWIALSAALKATAVMAARIPQAQGAPAISHRRQN